MTPDEIIEMARQAGFDEHHAKFDTRIETFAKLVAEKALQEHAMQEVQRLGQEIEQEPVAYLCENAVGHRYFRWKKPSSTYKPIPLYTSPPQRKPLTDEEISEIAINNPPMVHEFARAIEAAHGIKGAA